MMKSLREYIIFCVIDKNKALVEQYNNLLILLVMCYEILDHFF